MVEIIVGCILAFLVTLAVIPAIIVIAKKKKLYDEPDDKRKLHKQPIPSLGGLGMFIGFIMTLLVTINFSRDASEFQYYIAAFLLIFFLGIKDDILIISPGKKILGQLLAAAILIFKSNLLINNMHGLLGIYEIPQEASYLLTTFSIVVIINAFNLIDGVDGLAGGLGLIGSLVFGSFFLINNNYPYAILAFTFSGSLIAFLYYNLYPAKIFMGDTGSLMVGLVNCILVIKFIETAESSTIYPVNAAPAVGFAILLLPLMDTLRVFSMRIIAGRSPFSPDRTHIHHLLLNRGFSHKQVTFICVGATIIVSVFALLLQAAGTTILLAILIAAFCSLIYVVMAKKTKYKLRVIKGDVKAPATEADVKLVSLFEKKAAAVEEE